MAGGNLPFGLAPTGSLTSYTPTLRERATDWLRTKLFSDDRAGQGRAEKVMDVASMTPFGFGVDMYDAGREAGMGNYGGAALTLGMAGAPGPSPKIRAFHSSPHSFDKFDMGKIGTGEGAQAYGHGLYAAESEDVSGFGGQYWNQFAQRFIDKKDPEGIATFALKTAKGDRQGAISYLEGLINKSEPNSPVGKVGKDALTMLKNGEHVGPWTYEVNINADPDTFLDWDKPLSEQPEAIKQTLTGKLGFKPAGWPYNGYLSGRQSMLRPDAGGDEIYRALGKERAAGTNPFPSKEAATEILREAGIPGIKYLDAGSRGAGDGTRNYVVFDDRLIEIVRKYGIAGASAMLGYNILDGMDPAQADELKRIEGNQ